MCNSFPGAPLVSGCPFLPSLSLGEQLRYYACLIKLTLAVRMYSTVRWKWEKRYPTLCPRTFLLIIRLGLREYKRVSGTHHFHCICPSFCPSSLTWTTVSALLPLPILHSTAKRSGLILAHILDSSAKLIDEGGCVLFGNG